jgi:hypothetical protein
MDAVGNSFGIQDQQPTEQPQEGGDNEAQGETSQPSQPSEDGSTQEGGASTETGSDRHQSQTRKDKDQLFDNKPKRGPRGELLDKNGQIVAATRREKQLAYNLNRAQFAANKANRDLAKYHQTFQSYKALDDVMKQNNLSHAHMIEAAQLRALVEKDPINGVRDIVARVLASGVTMEQLFGAGAAPEINARVITSELDRRLGPLEKQTRQQQEAQALTERATEMMETFVNDHPHAETHGVEISNLVANHGLTPERAYFELRSWTERRGFDFTAPLKPQIEAAMQRQPQQQRRTTPGDVRSVAPRSVPTTNGTQERGDFKSNTPWRDIASAVFTELNSKH